MPEPKISLRCPTCHASVREEAFFCPQCGNKIDRPAKSKGNSARIHDTEEVVAVGGQTSPRAGTTSSDETADGEVKKTASSLPSVDAGSKFQRVTNKARNVEGDVLQRVQKIRKISNVVIDEASYDPSLRFLLVAAALLVLFLLIVLLNKVIG